MPSSLNHQPSLFRSRAPRVLADDVERLICVLHQHDWQTAKQLQWYGWSDRTLRALAHASHGRIVGGNRGYRLTLEASAEEINEVTGRLRSQVRDMSQRVVEIERVYHQRREDARQ